MNHRLYYFLTVIRSKLDSLNKQTKTNELIILKFANPRSKCQQRSFLRRNGCLSLVSGEFLAISGIPCFIDALLQSLPPLSHDILPCAPSEPYNDTSHRASIIQYDQFHEDKVLCLQKVLDVCPIWSPGWS